MFTRDIGFSAEYMKSPQQNWFCTQFNPFISEIITMAEKLDKLTAPIRKDRVPLQDLLPLSAPLRIFIDPCDICNFRCNFCFQSKQDNFNGQMMNEKLFTVALDRISEFKQAINVIHLYGFGEPLLNPNVARFVRMIKASGLSKEVAITSNGSMLTHEISRTLVDAGLDRLSISLNGVCDDDFLNTVGVKVKFDDLYNEIKYFYSIRGKCHLHVKINGECFDANGKEKFIELFEKSADTLNIDHVVSLWPDIKDSRSFSDGQYGVSKENTCGKICPQMFYELAIHSDGSVSPCCADYLFHKENLGNIVTDSLVDIWNGRKLKEMRINALRNEKISYDACTNCDYPQCAATVDITPYRESILKKYI